MITESSTLLATKEGHSTILKDEPYFRSRQFTSHNDMELYPLYPLQLDSPMASIAIDFAIMSPPPASTNPQQNPPDESNEEEVRDIESWLQPGLEQHRNDPLLRPEIDFQNHLFGNAIVMGSTEIPLSSPLQSHRMDNIDIDTNARATRSTESEHGDRHHDRTSEVHRTSMHNVFQSFSGGNPNSQPSSLEIEGSGIELSHSYDSLTNTIGVDPLIDVNEPATFHDTDELFMNPRDAHQQDNQGHGTARAIVPNPYEQQYLHSLYSYGSYAPQHHNTIMNLNTLPMDPITFPYHQRGSFPRPLANYPTQAANTAPSIDKKPSPRPSVSQRSDPSPQQEANVRSHLKPPPVASLSRTGTHTSSRTSQDEGQEPSKSKEQECEVGRSAARRTQPKRKSTRMKTSSKTVHKKGTLPKHPKTRAKTKIKAAVRQKKVSSSAVKYQTEPTQEQLLAARTPRKIQALRTWFKRLNELLGFKKSHGHTNVPQQYLPNHSLGIWVNKQRMEKKAKDLGKPNSLTDDKVRLLEDVGFIWAKHKGQAAWEEKFSELQQFVRVHGHCDVPTKNKSNRALGRWVSTQRANYKKHTRGESDNLRTDKTEMARKIRLLEGIGFNWSLLPGNSNSDDEDDDDEKVDSTSPQVEEPENTGKNEIMEDRDGEEDSSGDEEGDDTTKDYTVPV